MKHEDIDAFCADNSILYCMVEADHPNGAGYLFKWLDKRNPGEYIHVTKECFDAITEAELLKAVVNGRAVVQVTRIVGYYSHTDNWNKSKLGELNDRRAGEYKVAEEAL